MSTAPPQQKTATKKRGFQAMTSVAFVVSLVVHVVIFLFVGTVVIFEGAVPPNLFQSLDGGMVGDDAGPEVDLPPLMEEVMEPEAASPMDELITETVDLSEAMSTSDIIMSTAVSPSVTPQFTMPLVNTGNIMGGKVMSGVGSSGKVASGGGGGMGTPTTANIFGRSVSAKRFGAILDISNSTHKTIDIAVREVKSGFPDAILVLAPGCRISDDKDTHGGVVTGQEFMEDKEKKYTYQGGNAKNILYPGSFLKKLLKENRAFKSLWNTAVRDGRGYVVHLDLPAEMAPDKGRTDGKQLMIHGTDLAFKHLIDRGCDVIYWMADFNDSIDSSEANKLAKRMEANKIMLIQHDFDGATDKDKPQRKLVRRMVDRTDGEQIIGSGN